MHYSDIPGLQRRNISRKVAKAQRKELITLIYGYVMEDIAMDENSIAKEVVDSAYTVHRELGPGLLESVYEMALCHELESRKLAYSRQHKIQIVYKDMLIIDAFRADILVEKKLIIELKSIEAVSPVHKKQLITYLKLADCKLGLLINCGSHLIKDGITRVVNKL